MEGSVYLKARQEWDERYAIRSVLTRVVFSVGALGAPIA
jgi:hypothetical protein